MNVTEQLGVLAEAPVVLEAEAAHRDCALGELLALKPGALLQFPGTARDGAVRLLAGGILLGTAQVCQVSGQAAVRITSTGAEGEDHGAC